MLKVAKDGRMVRGAYPVTRSTGVYQIETEDGRKYVLFVDLPCVAQDGSHAHIVCHTKYPGTLGQGVWMLGATLRNQTAQAIVRQLMKEHPWIFQESCLKTSEASSAT